MAFPTVPSVTATAGNNSPSASSCVVNLPATINAGDLLIIIGGGDTLLVRTASAPAGWTVLDTGGAAGAANTGSVWALYRIADGTEGSTVTVPLSGNVSAFAAQCYRITGWEGSASGIAVGTAATGSSGAIDPPSVSMLAGGGENLFIGYGVVPSANVVASGAPTDYGSLTTTTSSGSGTGVSSFRRQLAASSDNPGTASLGSSDDWRANTIAVASALATGAPGSKTTEIAALGAVSGNGVPMVSGFYALVATVGPAAEAVETAQFSALAAVNGELTVPKTSQMAALVAYGVGIPERNTQRAWAFDLDGHTHYVLDLGTDRTVVYDLATEQWAQWGTEGFPIWNAQVGINWQDRIVAGDFIGPSIFEIRPTGSLDEEFRAVRRKVTGILPNPSRNYIAMDALYVMASVGDAQDGFAGTAEMTLRFSDDQGQNFYTFGVETLSSTDDNQELLFRSLGSYNMPGRIIEIEDLGGPVRIDSAQVVLR